MRQITARFRGRVLKLLMCFEECSRIEEFIVNLHVVIPMWQVPSQFIWFVVKECCMCGIRIFFLYDGNKGTVIEPLNSVVFTTWIPCAVELIKGVGRYAHP